MGYQLGSTIGSGFAPLIAISILATGDGNNYPMVALFTGGMCLISIVATYCAKETKEKELGDQGKVDSPENSPELLAANQ